MTPEPQQTDAQKTSGSSSRFPLPWLVAVGAILLYLVTLNHWVTLSSLPIVSKLTGWDWHPGYADWRPTFFSPLFYVLTFPVRWLPTSLEPVALNLFSAVCAALTLGLLARTIRLFPQDRTRDQRVRELGPSASLKGWRGYLPPVLAVLACGLQLSFWEHSTAATGEMLDLLVFAYLIRCLMEFRDSKKESWLTKFALVYGLGVTNNWALIGFFPFFLTAFVWFKGSSFFNWKFLRKIVTVGLLGLSLYLLLPLIYSATGGGNFGHLLGVEIKQQLRILLAIPRYIPLFLSLPTILALLFMGIRWPSFHGDVSAIGAAISTGCFRIMHLIFFGLSIWMFLDIQYSPRAMGAEVPFLAWLSFYYMAALSVGYFSGYILLVFGTDSLNRHERKTGLTKFVFRIVTLLVFVALAAPIYLVIINFPKINATNSTALSSYAGEMVKTVPSKGAIILSDERSRLLLFQAYCAREHKPIENMLFETSSLQHGEYIEYLRDRYPGVQKLLGTNQIPKIVEQIGLVRLLSVLNTQTNQQSFPIYYLQPSFGYYFERFYAVPHGITLELKPRAPDADMLNIPALPASVLNENEAYWNNQKSLATLPAQGKLSDDVKIICHWQSRSLNLWGTELQKANKLKEASVRFDQALKLYPDNYMAQINKDYNDNLRKGNSAPVDSKEIFNEALRKNRSLDSILSAYGPPDEPELLLRFGQTLASGGNLLQAYNLFQRRLALRPGDFDAQLALAKTYVDLRQPDKGMAMLNQAKAQATTAPAQAEVLRIEVLVYLEKNDFTTAENLLKAALEQKPQDEMCISLMADFYRMIAISALREKNPELAKERFKTSLSYLDRHLNLLKSKNKNNSSEASELLLKRAQLLIQLADYTNAIANLNELSERLPGNGVVLMNRAIAELQCKKFAEAKQDYKALLKLLPTGPYAVYYGLAEIAYQQKDKPEAIKNYELYLKFAPTNSPEYKPSEDRLKELKKSP